MLLLPQKLFSWPLVLYLFSEDPWCLHGLSSFIPYKSLHNAYKELPRKANSLWILFILCTYSSHSLEGRSSEDAFDEGQS